MTSNACYAKEEKVSIIAAGHDAKYPKNAISLNWNEKVKLIQPVNVNFRPSESYKRNDFW